ncbi:MAG: PseG/SpsG family protein [Gemmataceae bacterium]
MRDAQVAARPRHAKDALRKDACMDVKRGPILFRCDATPETGFESFYHCLSLAAALQRRRRGTHFLSYLEPLALAQAIHRGNNEWHAAEAPIHDAGDLGQTLREIRRMNASAVVLAGTRVSEDYIRAVRRTGALTLVIDTDAQVHLPADLIINPLMAPGRKQYRFDGGAQMLLGRKFALCRGIFRRQRTIRAMEQPGPFRALVAFGDDDAADQTLLRTQQLLALPGVDKISILTRSHHQQYCEIREFAEENSSRVEVITEIKEMMTRLVRGHFALTSGDSWSLEMACVGIPQLLLPATPRHAASAKKMDDEGIATLVGPGAAVTIEELDEAVQILLNDPMERLTMSRCARNRVDGRGGDRIVNGLEIMLHSPARKAPAFAIAA